MVAALQREIAACRICAGALDHEPRPVVQFSETSRILIIGQAPGSKVHESGIPWDDASGARLREWTGLTDAQLHDPALTAIVPMGFCYPGKASGGDKPPRRECAPAWHGRVLEALPAREVTLLVGTYAQAHYLPGARQQSMAQRVRDWRRHTPDIWPLPHPSWRSTMFMRAHPWFETDLLPALRRRIADILQA